MLNTDLSGLLVLNTMSWVREYMGPDGLEYLDHVDGVGWYDTPRPRRLWHRHSAQTRGRFDDRLTERCSCGAARLDGSGPWINGHTRRRR